MNRVATITKAIAQDHILNLRARLIPADVLKAIDQAELMDRLDHVAELNRRQKTTTDSVLRKGYAAVARAVLTAQPRDATERQVADRIAKAAGMPSTSQADALRREAQELLEVHPPAPRRAAAVAKAASGPMVLVYDKDGRPAGICPQDAIQPVARVEDVIKAGRRPSAARPRR